MSIIRAAVVVGLGIAMLPSDRAQQAALYDKAAGAVAWTATFCDRNPTTCAHAHAGWEVFKAKAQFAGALAYDAAITYVANSQTTASVTGLRAPVQPQPQFHSGTLTDDDMAPRWRGLATASAP